MAPHHPQIIRFCLHMQTLRGALNKSHSFHEFYVDNDYPYELIEIPELGLKQKLILRFE